MTVTANTEVEFNGLLLAGAYEIQQIDGLAGSPDVRANDLTLLHRHGLRATTDYLAGRGITLTVAIYAWTDEEFAAAVDAFRTAFAVGQASEQQLSFQLAGIAGGEAAFIYARPRRMSLPLTSTYWDEMAVATVELFATDPLLYGETELSQVVSLPTAGGGVEFDMVAPITFGAVSTGGTITAVNDGNFEADITFRIDGPVTNPRIESLTAGRTLALDITLDVGEWLTVDSRSRTVLLNGTASRYSSLSAESRWFTLAPGSNELTFRASTPTVATLSASWRSTWV